MTIIIIGASFAGLACAQAVIDQFPQARVLILERQTSPLHYPNAANRLLKGEIGEFAVAQVPTSALLHQPQIQFYPGHEVVEIDWENHRVKAIFNKEERDFAYDRLILATGASQSLDLANEESYDRLLTFKSLTESRDSLEKLKTARSVLVVGAGQLGLEGLDALSHLPLDLTLVEAQGTPLAKHLDQDMAMPLLQRLIDAGIRVILDASVERISGQSAHHLLTIDMVGDCHQADAVLLATSFSPNTSYLPTDLHQHSDGSLVVDAYLRTNLPDIFAVGDMIQLPIDYFGTAYLPTIEHAVLTGRLAALNLDGHRLPLPICHRQVRSQLFGLHLLSLGATARELTLFEKFSSLAGQLEPSGTWVKFHLRTSDHQLLGVQVLGQAVTDRLLDCLIWAIKAKLTVEGLLHMLLSWEQLSPLERQLMIWLTQELQGLQKGGWNED